MKHSWAVAYVSTAIACALPALLVTYPPLTDLPQHVAQVAQAMRGQLGPGQFVAWWQPNNLVYLPIMLLWRFVPPHQVGSLTVSLLAIICVSASFALAKYKRRPPVAAALASLLFYGGVLYWGMLNFVLGWPAFVLWWILFDRAFEGGRAAWERLALIAIATFVLLWTHVLAFGFAGLVALALTFYDWRRVPLRAHALRLATFVPAAALAIPWAVQLRSARAASGFDVDASWSRGLLERAWLMVSQSANNGDDFETLVLFGALSMWVLGGLLARRGAAKSGSAAWDGKLLATAAVAMFAALAFPANYFNTMWFEVRWIPWAVMLLLLASPGLPLRSSASGAFGAVLVTYFSLTTTANWLAFERTNLVGLSAAIRAVPTGARVLGLDFLGDPVAFVATRPFMHLMAYATVERGARTNFDFSQHQTGLVRGPSVSIEWTQGLEWYPEWVRPSDFGAFEYVLLGSADPEVPAAAFAQWLGPVTDAGLWRLYKSKVFQPGRSSVDLGSAPPPGR